MAKPNNALKYWHIWVSAGAIIFLGFLFWQDTLAGLAWQKIHRPDLALLLLNKDEKLAMRLGSYYFNGGAYDLKRARYAYEKALAIDSNLPLVHHQIGRLHFIEGNLPKALEEINFEIKMSANPHAFYVRGLIYGYMRLFPAAEEDFKHFVRERPLVWAGYNDLAWVLAKQGKFLDARKVIHSGFAAVLGTREKNPWLWASLGVSELNLKNYESAGDAFERALGMAKGITPEYFWSAYPGNDRRQAGQAYQQFLATLYFNLGVAYENLGELEKAKEVYQAYLAASSKPAPDQTAVVAAKIQLLP